MKYLYLSLAVLCAFQDSSADQICWYDADSTKASCYTLTESVATWEAAGTACGEGKTLASIETTAEQQFLDSHLGELGMASADTVWFGANYKKFTGDTWRWTRSTTEDADLSASEITFTNGDDEEGNDAAILHDVDGSPDWVFHHAAPTSTHYVLCEAVDATEIGASFKLNFNDGTAVRHYHGFTEAEDEVTWEAANAKCLGAGAWLAKVETGADAPSIRDSLETALNVISEDKMNDAEDFWIGLHRGEWQWTDDESIEDPTNWNPVPQSTGCGYITFLTGLNAAWMVDYDCTMDPASPGLCEEIIADTTEPTCRTITVDEEELQHCIQATAAEAVWAEDACPDDYSLVEVNDEEELAFINTHLPRLGVTTGDDMWMGGRYKLGNWRWIENGEEKDDTDFTWENPAADDTHTRGFISDTTTQGTFLFNKAERTALHHVLCETETNEAVTGESFRFSIMADTRHFVGFNTEAGHSVTWTAANAMCDGVTDTDAWLATVDDDNVLAAINTELGIAAVADDSFWVGVYRSNFEWLQAGAITDEAWHPWGTGGLSPGCGYMTYSDTNLDTEWSFDAACDATKPALCEITQDVPEPGNGDDDGLSDGEIAAIAVSSSVVIGGAAAAGVVGGYYVYSKSSSRKVDVEQGEGGEGVDYQKEEEEVEGGDEGDEQPGEEAQAEE